MINKNGKLKILDLGCATGSMLECLKNFGSVVGLDNSAYALKQIKKCAASLVQSDASRLPFKRESFDVVVLFDLLYHKNITDEAQILTEVHKVLKKNGSILITDSAFMSLYGTHDIAAQGIRRFNREKIFDLLHQSNFKVVHFSYNYMLLFPIVWVKRKVLTRFGHSNQDSKLEFSKTNVFVDGILSSLFNLEFMLSTFVALPLGVTFSCWGRK